MPARRKSNGPHVWDNRTRPPGRAAQDGRDERDGPTEMGSQCVYVAPFSHVSRVTGHGPWPLEAFSLSCLGLFDLDDRLAFIRSAIQAGIMRQLDLVALRTDGHARRCDAQLLCTPLVASFPGMFMFRIWHGDSFSLSIAGGHAMMLTVRRSCGS